MFEQMIEIIGRLDALRKTAKLYHWNCNGFDFYSDHLLFDEIVEKVDGWVDDISEKYMMAVKPTNIMEEEYDILVHNKEEYFGRKLSTNDEMAAELLELVIQLVNLIGETDTGIRGVENQLDDIADGLMQYIGFLNKRVGKK